MRLRWYGDTVPENGMVMVFVEIKSRRGFASSKRRVSMEVPAADLAPEGLCRGIVPAALLRSTLAGLGYFPEKLLRSVIRISYERLRFNELLSGVRVSIDTGIRAMVVAADLGRNDREVRLPGGVIEVKGPSLELPRTLRRLRFLDTDWSRFSKYGLTLDVHFARPGTVARNWPSGRGIIEA